MRLLGIFTALSLALATASSAAPPDWPAPVPIRTCADEPCATIAMGKAIYRVPKSYLPGSDIPPDRQGVHPAIWLNLLLPDFRPAGDDRKEFDRVGWHNQLRGLYEHGHVPLDLHDYARTLLRWGHIAETDFTIENGCNVYHGDMIGNSELHVCELPDRSFVYKCSTDPLYVKRPFCDVNETLNDGDLLNYSYSYDYASHSVTIDNYVRSMLHRFSEETLGDGR